MKQQITALSAFALWALAMSLQSAVGKPSAKVEIIEPFDTWLATEKIDFYVRITNTGGEPLPLPGAGHAGEDLFFEGPPAIPSIDIQEEIRLPRVENARTPRFPGDRIVLPPGGVTVLSDLDYNDSNLTFPELFPQVRVHFLIERGVWFSSDWTVRKILPVPDLTDIKPLFEYELDPMFRGQPLEEVRPVKVGVETWLFITRSPTYAGRRLCRVPDGVKPAAFKYDQEACRLTIRFDDGEEDVVINTRTGRPLTGSERTVPHLYLWKKLSGRPFTDVYQNTLDWMARKKAADQGKPGSPQSAPGNPPEGVAPQNTLYQKPQTAAQSGESIPDRKPWWLWLVLGATALCGSIVAVLRWRRGRMRIRME